MAKDSLIQCLNTKPIYRKGVAYHLFLCVDCGKEHLTQKGNGGQPVSPRCLSCAATKRGLGRVCTPEKRAKISTSLMGHPSFAKKGRVLSLEQREQIRQRMLGKKYKLGKKLSPESRERVRQGALSRAPFSEETRAKMGKHSRELWRSRRHPMLGQKHTPEAIEKISMSSLRWHAEHQHPMLGKTHTEDIRELLGRHSRERWANLEYKDKLVRKITNANFQRPTLPEQVVMEILDGLCPCEYKYTGDGRVIINGQAPDFVNANGRKKIIEVFGDYWHSEKVRGKAKYKEEQDKLAEYAGFGFSCLIIWEGELKNKDKVRERIIAFNKEH